MWPVAWEAAREGRTLSRFALEADAVLSRQARAHSTGGHPLAYPQGIQGYVPNGRDSTPPGTAKKGPVPTLDPIGADRQRCRRGGQPTKCVGAREWRRLRGRCSSARQRSLVFARPAAFVGARNVHAMDGRGASGAVHSQTHDARRPDRVVWAAPGPRQFGGAASVTTRGDAPREAPTRQGTWSADNSVY